jgi:sterol desaturase/sphingolipid hydroxylase (fatty acid hydroxylase superfamily)
VLGRRVRHQRPRQRRQRVVAARPLVWGALITVVGFAVAGVVGAAVTGQSINPMWITDDVTLPAWVLVGFALAVVGEVIVLE